MGFKSKWKNGTVVLQSEKEEMIQTFTSPAIPMGNNAWRVWYSVHNKKAYRFGYADGEFGERFKKTEARISGRKSSRGLNIIGIPKHWNLVQPVYIAMPGGTERIYFWAHAADGICRYLVAESDDGTNFLANNIHRPCLYHPNDRAVTSTTLKNRSLTIYCHDGRKNPLPDEPEAPADMLANDATNVYLLPDGTFELYSAEVIPVGENDRGYVAHAPCAGLLRIIQRRTSSDGIDWSPGRHIMKPDLNDPEDLQFYYLSVTHTPRGRIGTLGYYRVGSGVMEMEFCFSKNGSDWRRPCRGAGIRRRPGIESIYAPHSMIEKNGQYYLFHTSYNYTHHGALGRHSGIEKKSMVAVSTIEAEAFEPFLAF